MSSTASLNNKPEEPVQNRARWKTAIAGILGNLSIVIFQPLENVKLRLQANDGMRNHHLPKYDGFIDTFKQMWKQEGYVAFYRGMYVNILANVVSGGAFFGLYADGKKRYNYDRQTSPLWLTVWISLRAGLVTMAFVTPFWCLKTRVTLHWNEKEQSLRGHKLLQNTVSNMYKNEGIGSFFRGMPAQLALSFYAVIQMVVYEKLSKLFGISDIEPKGTKTPDAKTFFVGGTSRWVASAVFYPVNVIRTRLQKQRFSGEEVEVLKKQRNIDVKGVEPKDVYYTTVRRAAYDIWINEGVRGFYKGCFANLLRIFPHSGLFFLIYESTNHILDKI